MSMTFTFPGLGLRVFKRRQTRLLAARSRAVAQECHRAQLVQSQYEGWGTANVGPVLAIWLIFYAIAVVGALTGPRPTASTPEMAEVVDGARESGLR